MKGLRQILFQTSVQVSFAKCFYKQSLRRFIAQIKFEQALKIIATLHRYVSFNMGDTDYHPKIVWEKSYAVLRSC